MLRLDHDYSHQSQSANGIIIFLIAILYIYEWIITSKFKMFTTLKFKNISRKCEWHTHPHTISENALPTAGDPTTNF